MVDKLFAARGPSADDRLLDPGCGPGAFIAGVIRWCERHSHPAPHIVGVESDLKHVETARAAFHGASRVEIRHADFLRGSPETFDFIIGNPPYVALADLSDIERHEYKATFTAATNRFDLYQLFFEQATRQLKVGGRLVYITPEKFLYVESATSLRRLLRQFCIEELHFLDENTFADLVTYPLVTSITNSERNTATRVVLRDQTKLLCSINASGDSWLPAINGRTRAHHGLTLGDISLRVSCGVATGSDSSFVVPSAVLDRRLTPFAHPTVSGRQLRYGELVTSRDSMLCPYASDGRLLAEDELGGLLTYLSKPAIRAKLMARTCVKHKPWFAFHENPPLPSILRPKILCKDIGRVPEFFLDEAGEIVPRHSVYYIVPRDAAALKDLAGYLESKDAQQWLDNHCQRAAKGFVRLQSHILKRLPVPSSFASQLFFDDVVLPPQRLHA